MLSASRRNHNAGVSLHNVQCTYLHGCAGEKFETFWDDGEQQWRYRDAKRLDVEEAARCAFETRSFML